MAHIDANALRVSPSRDDVPTMQLPSASSTKSELLGQGGLGSTLALNARAKDVRRNLQGIVLSTLNTIMDFARLPPSTPSPQLHATVTAVCTAFVCVALFELYLAVLESSLVNLLFILLAASLVCTIGSTRRWTAYRWASTPVSVRA